MVNGMNGNRHESSHGHDGHRLFFYILVSGSQTIIEYVTFAVLQLMIPAVIANAVAVICSASYNFVMNRNVTFKASGNMMRSIILFILLWVWNLLFSTTVIGAIPAMTGVDPMLVKLGCMACQFAWGYPLCRHVIFK